MVYTLAVLALIAAPCADATEAPDVKAPMENSVPVFRAGEDNPYRSIRIPSIINAGGKFLVALAEGRYVNADQGKNDIIVSLSEDGGRTWSAPAIAAEAKGATFNNPYIMYDPATEQLVLFFQCYPPGVSEQGGNKPAPGWADPMSLRNLVCFSRDGKTWTAPQDVTPTTKHEDAMITCSGPNPGVVLTRGAHKGRLVVVFNEAPKFGNWHLTAAYSDDHGQTWTLGEKSPSGFGINEVSVAETEEGGVFVVSRHYGGPGGNTRRVAYSADGGATWNSIGIHTELPCCGCQNGMARYSYADDAERGSRSRIIFTAPRAGRKDGFIKMSYDDGKSWPVQKDFGNGPFAYSAICPLEPGFFGVLYEVNGHPLREIRFARISMDWLTDGNDSGKAEEGEK